RFRGRQLHPASPCRQARLPGPGADDGLQALHDVHANLSAAADLDHHPGRGRSSLRLYVPVAHCFEPLYGSPGQRGEPLKSQERFRWLTITITIITTTTRLPITGSSCRRSAFAALLGSFASFYGCMRLFGHEKANSRCSGSSWPSAFIFGCSWAASAC